VRITSATTVFRDKLGVGISFPVGKEALAEHLRQEIVAVYFIRTATWLRQAAPLDSPHLPALRLQRRRVGLRVRNERIAPLPEGCSLHAIVYAVPSRIRKVVFDALLSRARDWAEGGRARPAAIEDGRASATPRRQVKT
jgi:hypothetical protein